MTPPSSTRLGRVVTAVVAAGIGLFAWLFRFNDPNGSFAGLTDDHFFYVIRGWQILFGDLPVRDFVDHGAPLFYYVAAVVQLVFGRGTLSELAFTASMLALAASLTFVLCRSVSGSLLAGLAGAAFHVLLEPRFYNYPKVLVYAVAIPLLWWYADGPSVRRAAALAAVTVVGFLFRHDHGVFVGAAMAVLLVSLSGVAWSVRIRHALVYAGVCLALLAPYLVFIQVNEGVGTYFREASTWAEHDRDRAPIVWPGLLDYPDGRSEAASAASPLARAAAVVTDNSVAWIFYLELALPIVALAVLLLVPASARRSWPQARAKLLALIALAAALDAGFLRSPLAARLADPSVPLAGLVAWLLAVLAGLVRGRFDRQPLLPKALAWRVALALPLVLVLTVPAVVLSHGIYHRLDSAAMTDRWGKPFERAGSVARQLRSDWQLAGPGSASLPPIFQLVRYVNACTRPTDRILLQGYFPQVAALGDRAFAGGYAEVRAGFFTDAVSQERLLTRLRQQSVPLVLAEAGEPYESFRKDFPSVASYLDASYREIATREFGGDDVLVLARRDLTSRGTWAELGWPCFGSGVVGVR